MHWVKKNYQGGIRGVAYVDPTWGLIEGAWNDKSLGCLVLNRRARQGKKTEEDG